MHGTVCRLLCGPCSTAVVCFRDCRHKPDTVCSQVEVGSVCSSMPDDQGAKSISARCQAAQYAQALPVQPGQLHRLDSNDRAEQRAGNYANLQIQDFYPACLIVSICATADEGAGPSETIEIDDDDDFEAPVPKKPKAVQTKAQKEPRQAAKRSCTR